MSEEVRDSEARDPFTYRDAGVDIEGADALKRRLGALVESTRTGEVRSTFGSFGGRFHVAGDAELVASADGVGTKLRVAFRAGRHDTVGEDLVNHCVNDVLAEGATPLVFLDYLATGSLEPDVCYAVVEGVARACRENGCALLGGETAEMPDMYAEGEYDLAGFLVGRVTYSEVAGREVRVGDGLVALASNGLHTNGYTFVRRLIFDRLDMGVDDPFPGTAETVGEVLLRPHRSYLGVLRESCEERRLRALAHVTGGGLTGNVSRVLPADVDAVVDLESWEPGPEFRFLWRESGASRDEIYRTFNMGAGMVAVVAPEAVEAVVSSARAAGCEAWSCGELVGGTGRVRLEGRESPPGGEGP